MGRRKGKQWRFLSEGNSGGPSVKIKYVEKREGSCIKRVRISNSVSYGRPLWTTQHGGRGLWESGVLPGMRVDARSVRSRKMASAKFLEEALSNDVDESAVSALVGSLENQLVTSTPVPPLQGAQTAVLNQNHINSAISNGGTSGSVGATQKHGTLANGETECAVTTVAQTADNKVLVNNTLPGTIITGAPVSAVQHNSNTNDGVKIVYTQGGQAMSNAGTIIPNRVAFPQQNLPNGTIGSIAPQTVLQTNTSNVQTIQAKQPTLVIKTSVAPGTAPGIVTLPMNVATATVPQVNNVGSPTTQTPTVLSNLQVVNVRPGLPTQPQKGQTAARVVLSAPQLVGARPGAPVS